MDDLSKTHRQTIILTLTDGRVIKAAIPATLDPKVEIRLRKIEITEPKPLPEGCIWGDPGEL